jgi:hypothetical protein
VTVDGITQPVPVATVRIGSRVTRTDSLGRATLRVRFAHAGRRPVVATATEFLPASPTITVR